jgi:predicted nuclease of predicted toxin-antitoxin system
MYFFLDENMPKKVLQYLEKRGHQVYDIRGTEHEGCLDEEIFKLAQEKNAIFLTTDKDFFHTIPFLYTEHVGVVVVALSQPNTKNILEKVIQALYYLRNIDLHSRCMLLTDKRMYISPKK